MTIFGRTLFVLVVAASASSCLEGSAAAGYTATFPTKEAAVAAVFDALAARDEARLTALPVTEREFKDLVWPALPASRPEVGVPVDYVWADTSLKGRGSLDRTLREHGGRRYRVEGVAFDGPAVNYGSFLIHRKTRVTVRDEQGRQAVVRAFGSMLEADGQWKVFSFVVD